MTALVSLLLLLRSLLIVKLQIFPYGCMNRKLIQWATLTGKNNHCNNHRSPVMTLQRIVAVFSVAIHASP